MKTLTKSTFGRKMRGEKFNLPGIGIVVNQLDYNSIISSGVKDFDLF